MKNCSILLIVTFLFSCSSTPKKNSLRDEILGNWKSDSLQIRFVHAVIHIPLTDKPDISQERIKTNFTIDFNEDSTFVFTNLNGPTRIGKYELGDSSLTLNNGLSDWLKFRIDNITKNRLVLKLKKTLFYSIKNDTVELFTGDDNILVMKKI